MYVLKGYGSSLLHITDIRIHSGVTVITSYKSLAVVTSSST